MKFRIVLLSMLSLVGISSTVSAAVVPFTLGTAVGTFGNGDEKTFAEVQAVTGGNPAPFDQSYGNDAVGPSFSENWTHNLAAISGETITGATISIGIWGHEPNLEGNQVATFTIDGISMTTQLNALFEASVDGTTSDQTYNVYSIDLSTIPGAIAALSDYSATFALALQGDQVAPIDENNDFAGAWLIGSALIVTTEEAVAAVPEPSSMLLLTGVGGLFGLAYRRRRKQEPEAETSES